MLLGKLFCEILKCLNICFPFIWENKFFRSKTKLVWIISEIVKNTGDCIFNLLCTIFFPNHFVNYTLFGVHYCTLCRLSPHDLPPIPSHNIWLFHRTSTHVTSSTSPFLACCTARFKVVGRLVLNSYGIAVCWLVGPLRYPSQSRPSILSLRKAKVPNLNSH